MIKRLVAAPAVHFALAGAVLFLVIAWRDASPGDVDGRARITVSAARVGEARQAFMAVRHHPPTPAEEALLVRQIVDEEVLLQHALDLGLTAQEPVERRLRQIASFVAEDPARALELGLHRDDLVIRRILVDSVKRLIRAAVLTREPAEEAMATYLAEHADRFRQPEALRLAVVAAGKRDGEAKELPLLERRDLERRYGHGFVEAVDAARVGEWQGPLPSRYGAQRVLVREHRPERTATLAEVRDTVHDAVLQELADRWLAARTAELRAEMEIVVADVVVAGVELDPTTAGGAP